MSTIKSNFAEHLLETDHNYTNIEKNMEILDIERKGEKAIKIVTMKNSAGTVTQPRALCYGISDSEIRTFEALLMSPRLAVGLREYYVQYYSM
ncbi:hypothetical protein J6590_087929 [Homalodisca vitripennis]|nr:hypothetical protein J6590_087929 [Homalodisca vitripennis]